MKYLIVPIVLAIAFFIAINAEGRKWEKYKGKQPSSKHIAKMGIDQYNNKHQTKYTFKYINSSEKALEVKEERIRVRFYACNTTKIKKPNSKKDGKSKKPKQLCKNFRVTYVKDPATKKPTLWVKILDDKKTRQMK